MLLVGHCFSAVLLSGGLLFLICASVKRCCCCCFTSCFKLLFFFLKSCFKLSNVTLYISPYYLYLKCVSCLSQFCLLSCHLVYLESRASDQMNSCKHGWHYSSAAHYQELGPPALCKSQRCEAAPQSAEHIFEKKLVGNSWPCISPQPYQTMKSSGCCTGQLWCRPLSLSRCCCYQTVNGCFLLHFIKFPLQQLKPNSLSSCRVAVTIHVIELQDKHHSFIGITCIYSSHGVHESRLFPCFSFPNVSAVDVKQSASDSGFTQLLQPTLT